MEPTKRLGSEAEGKAWLDAAAQVYAHHVGSTSGGGDSAGGAVKCRSKLGWAERGRHVQLYALALGKGPSIFMTIIAVIGLIMVRASFSFLSSPHE
jgi:hypothetical protein